MKWIGYGCAGVAFLVVIVCGVYSCCTPNSNFWNITISQALTIFIAIGITFFATQFKTDQRKQKEHAENIIVKIQCKLDDMIVYIINDTVDLNVVNMCNREVNNAVSTLKNYSKVLKFTSQYEYIEKEFLDYKTFIGNHIKDIEYLKSSEDVLRKYVNNINQKCDDIIFKLYK